MAGIRWALRVCGVLAPARQKLLPPHFMGEETEAEEGPRANPTAHTVSDTGGFVPGGFCRTRQPGGLSGTQGGGQGSPRCAPWRWGWGRELGLGRLASSRQGQLFFGEKASPPSSCVTDRL